MRPIFSLLCGAVLSVATLGACHKAISNQELGADGMNLLRNQFNGGDCEAIYREAEPPFHVRTLAEWTSQCQQLRTKLGTWQSLQIRVERIDGTPVALLAVGEADFENGHYQIETHWHVRDGRARLYYISLWGGNDKVNIPTAPRPPQRELAPRRGSE